MFKEASEGLSNGGLGEVEASFGFLGVLGFGGLGVLGVLRFWGCGFLGFGALGFFGGFCRVMEAF